MYCNLEYIFYFYYIHDIERRLLCKKIGVVVYDIYITNSFSLFSV